MTALLDHRAGALSDDELDRRLLDRQRLHELQFDSATFLTRAGARLARLFPEARFIYSHRDAAAWVSSFLHIAFVLFRDSSTDEEKKWGARYLASVAPDLSPEALASLDNLGQQCAAHVEALLSFWYDSLELTVRSLPADRLLIFSTDAILTSTRPLALFCGISDDQLHPPKQRAHTGKHSAYIRAALQPTLDDIAPKWEARANQLIFAK
jgi:hypothetical protein